MLTVHAVSTEDELVDLAPLWDELLARCGRQEPFQSFAWMAGWWKEFGATRRPWVRHRLLILVVSEADRLVGILPFYRTTVGLGGRLAFRYIRPLGSDRNLTELRAPLILPERAAEVLVVAAEYLREQAAGWDLLNWGHLPAGLEPPAHLPGLIMGTQRFAPTEAFQLALAPSWAAFAAGLKRNVKEAIRKSYNSLKRDQIDVQFEVVAEPTQIAALLPAYFALHSQRAQQADTVAHPDVFEIDRHRSFLAKLVLDPRMRGRSQLYVLRVGPNVIAARLGFVVEQTLYLYFSGYDPAYGKYSVMTRLVTEVLKHAIERGMTSVHLSFGRDVSKTRWGPLVTTFQTYLQVGASWWSRSLFRLIGLVKAGAFGQGAALEPMSSPSPAPAGATDGDAADPDHRIAG